MTPPMRWGLLLLWWMLVGLCCHADPRSCTQEQTPIEMPSFRRIWQTKAPPLDDAGHTEWTRLTRQEFERTVQSVQAKAAAARRPPWLTAARYVAAWKGEHLEGTASWTIHNPHDTPGLIQLPLFNLALSEAPTWQNRPALLGVYRDPTLQLLVEKPGTQELNLRWSARLESRTDGQWCRLVLPPAAECTLELTLPAEMRVECPAARQSVTLLDRSGDPAAPRRWLIQCTGMPPGELTIVLRTESNPPEDGVLEVSQRSEYDFDLTGVRARFMLDWEHASGRLREVLCDVDDQIEILEVRHTTAKQTLAWEWDRSVAPARLRIKLPEHLQRKIAIEIIAAFKPDTLQPIQEPGIWRVSCRAVRPLGISRLEEKLRLRWSASIDLVDWRFGGYHPMESPSTEKYKGGEWTSLTLEGRTASYRHRPSVAAFPVCGKAQVRQETWWQIFADGMQLNVKSHWQATSGQLHTLQMRLPEGWRLDDVSSTPPEALAGWSWSAEHAQMPLQVELREPVRAEQSVTLHLRLKPMLQSASATAPQGMSLPHVVPLQVQAYFGVYAISLPHIRHREGFSPVFTSQVEDIAARAVNLPPQESSLWTAQDSPPEYRFQSHSANAGGRLRLQAIPPQAEAITTVEINRGENQTHVKYDLQIHPLAGPLARFRLRFTEPPPALQWQGLNQAAVPQWKPDEKGGTLSFAQPITSTIRLRASFSLSPTELVPLPIPETAFWTGRVQVPPQGKNALELSGKGLDKIAWIAPLGAPVFLGDMYRYSASSKGIRFIRHQTDGNTTTQIVSASNGFRLRANGGMEGEYRAILRLADRLTPRLKLPPGTIILRFELNGQSFIPEMNQDSVLALPEIATQAQIHLIYELPVSRSWWGCRVELSAPRWVSPSVTPPTVGNGLLLPDAFLPLFLEAPQSLVAGHRWSPLAEDRRVVILVREQLLSFTGGILGAICLLLCLRSNRPRLSQVACLAAVPLAAWYCFPSGWMPLAIGPVIGLGLGIAFRTWRSRRKRLQAGLVPDGGILLTGCILIGGPVFAPCNDDKEKAAIVYLLPGASDNPKEQVALVPNALWRQLHELDSKVCLDAPPYLLTQSVTAGRVQQQSIAWQVDLSVHVLSHSPVDIPLRIGTSKLRGVDVDRIPAIALPLPVGDGIIVRIGSPGSHSVSLNWEMALQDRGTGCEAPCDLPRTAIAAAAVQLPEKAREVHAIGLLGREETTSFPDRVQWSGNPGAIAAWRLRWQQTEEGRSQAAVEELAHWDIHPQRGVTQQHWLKYRVVHGALRELRVVLPTQGRVRHLDLLPVAKNDAPRMRSWEVQSIEGVGNVLDVTLETAAEGAFYLQMELSSPLPDALSCPGILCEIGRLVPLETVQPLNVDRRGGWGSLSVAGMRWTMPATTQNLLHEVNKAQWARMLPALAAIQLRPQFTFQWKTWPSPQHASLLLKSLPPSLHVRQSVISDMAPGEVEFAVTAELTSLRTLPPLLRWQVPKGMHITDVKGSALQSWSIQGNTLLLWMQSGKINATLDLTGWVPLPTHKHGSSLALPEIRFQDAQHDADKLTLRTPPGFRAVWEGTAATTSNPGTDATPKDNEVVLTFPKGIQGLVRLERLPTAGIAAVNAEVKPGTEAVEWELRIQPLNRTMLDLVKIRLHSEFGSLLQTPGRSDWGRRVLLDRDGAWEWQLEGIMSPEPIVLSLKLPYSADGSVVLPGIEMPGLEATAIQYRIHPTLKLVEPPDTQESSPSEVITIPMHQRLKLQRVNSTR